MVVSKEIEAQASHSDLFSSQPEGTDMTRTGQVKKEPVCMLVTDSEPADEQFYLQYANEQNNSQTTGATLGYPELVGKEFSCSIVSEHMNSQLVRSEHFQTQIVSLDCMHTQPASSELAHSQPVTAVMVHSQLVAEQQDTSCPVNTEVVSAHPPNSELQYYPSVTSGLANSETLTSELMHSQNGYLQLVDFVNTESPGNELDPNAVGMEVASTQPLCSDVSSSQHVTRGKPRKRSIVWKHFTVENVGDGCTRAFCKVCRQSFAHSDGSKYSGTSHLKRHIAKGSCPIILSPEERDQLSAYMPKSAGTDMGGDQRAKKRKRGSPVYESLKFDQDRCRHEICRMIIMNEYPIHMIEHPGFVSFVQTLQPCFNMLSSSIVLEDCVSTFVREKQNVKELIERAPGRVCLTLHMCTSAQSTGYLFITGQFVDDNCKLHRKLLNVVMEPFPESDEALSHAVAICLSDWGLDRKLVSITHTQPLSETGHENLRALLAAKSPVLLNGKLLTNSCFASTLSSMAQEVLASSEETVKMVRNCVKYVKTDELHEERFLQLKQQLQVPTEKDLYLDNLTQWNTTYEMLTTASELRKVFSCFDVCNPDCKDVPPTVDWNQVENICTYLKLFYDTAMLVATKTIPSTDVLFHEMSKIQKALANAAASVDLFVNRLAKPLQDRFNEYWKKTYLILAIAVAMDPRFKMKLVDFIFQKNFANEAPVLFEAVNDGIHELYHGYMTLALKDGCSDNVKVEELQAGNTRVNRLLDFDLYVMDARSEHIKSELDQYLEELLLPRVQDIDVLDWWNQNKLKYPTLSVMARDVLSIPLSTVPPESVFETVTKEMDSHWCSLQPETVEALICAKDWLQQDSI